MNSLQQGDYDSIMVKINQALAKDDIRYEDQIAFYRRVADQWPDSGWSEACNDFIAKIEAFLERLRKYKENHPEILQQIGHKHQ